MRLFNYHAILPDGALAPQSGLGWLPPGGGPALDLTRTIGMLLIAEGRDPATSPHEAGEWVSSEWSRASACEKVTAFAEEHRLAEVLRIPHEWRSAPTPLHPSKIVAIGRNYRDHAKEMGNEVPTEPFAFLKPPSSLVAHDAEIVLPHRLDSRVDHEAELAVIVGRRAKYVTPDDALNHVAGYSILIDVSARTMQKDDQAKGMPWLRSKGFDSFCPIGPVIATPGEIPDPQALPIELKVNGEIRQSSTTAEMVFGVRDLIAAMSRQMTLEPGDVIATGTPAGVGKIAAGDLVEATIPPIGTLRVRVRAER